MRLAVGPLSQTPRSVVAPPRLLVFVDTDTCYDIAALACARSETQTEAARRALSRRSCPSDVRKVQITNYSVPIIQEVSLAVEQDQNNRDT